MNEKGGLQIPKDKNKLSNIVSRAYTAIQVETDNKVLVTKLLDELSNLFINTWFSLVHNFQVVIYNYFAAILCIII